MTTEEAVTLAADRGANPRRWAILAVIAVCQLMLVLDSSIVTIALPQAQHDLGISDATGNGWSPPTHSPSAAAASRRADR